LIYTAYENVRAYETAFDQADVLTLHALRIEGKRLRYALEFFEEVLGGELKGVIQMTKRLQDHLGDLNDTEVAGRYLREFMERFEQSQAALPFGERANVEPVVQYLAYQYAEKHRLLTTFPDTWAAFNAPEIRRGLALAVAAL
jgi:CHAD domain-containing protein